MLYLRPRLLVVLALGFSSGLPLALTASTLGIWLTEEGISMKAIGLFAAVSTPYTLKFLWAPLIDALPFPMLSRLLGQRRGWLLATQIALAGSIILLGISQPGAYPLATAACAVLVAFLSASQDIVIDALRVETLPPEEQGAGAAALVLGYRLGMIASTAAALFLAGSLGWPLTYAVMAALVGVGMAAALLAREPQRDAPPPVRRDLKAFFLEAVVAPFLDFMTRPHWLAILLFILLYKLADAFMGVMTGPFLIKTGYSKEDIATVVKLYGVIATIVGSMAGGALVARWGMLKTLWLCGLAHMLTNLLFAWLAAIPPDVGALGLAIGLENVTGGMGTAAFVAYVSQLCNRRFTATQYALLSSFAAFGRTWLATPAGWLQELLGWTTFFLLATALALPGLALLAWLSRREKPSEIRL